jgi:predicted DNA-binding protein
MNVVPTQIRLPEDLYQQLRREAFERGVTQSAVAAEALAAYFEQRGKR